VHTSQPISAAKKKLTQRLSVRYSKITPKVPRDSDWTSWYPSGQSLPSSEFHSELSALRLTILL
jgi:hypothetical protein